MDIWYRIREEIDNLLRAGSQLLRSTKVVPDQIVANAGTLVQEKKGQGKALLKLLGDTVIDLVGSFLCFLLEILSVVMTDKMFSNELSNSRQAALCIISLVTFLPMYIEQTGTRNHINVLGRIISWVILIPGDVMIIKWFYPKAIKKNKKWFIIIHAMLLAVRHLFSLINVLVGLFLEEEQEEDLGVITDNSKFFQSEIFYQMWCYFDWIPPCNPEIYNNFILQRVFGKRGENLHPGVGLLYFVYLTVVQLTILILQIKLECLSQGKMMYVIAILLIIHNFLAEVILIVPIAKVAQAQANELHSLGIALLASVSYILNAISLIVVGGLFLFGTSSKCVKAGGKVGLGIVIILGSPLCSIAKIISTRLPLNKVIEILRKPLDKLSSK